MHHWRDENVDWNGIDAAAQYIGEGLRRWGRVDVQQYKEKFGTVRVYCSLGLLWWPQLTYPAWWNPFYIARRLVNLGAVLFHKWLYRRYYRQAVARWPHLRQEILCCASYPELLVGL